MSRPAFKLAPPSGRLLLKGELRGRALIPALLQAWWCWGAGPINPGGAGRARGNGGDPAASHTWLLVLSAGPVILRRACGGSHLRPLQKACSLTRCRAGGWIAYQLQAPWCAEKTAKNWASGGGWGHGLLGGAHLGCGSASWQPSPRLPRVDAQGPGHRSRLLLSAAPRSEGRYNGNLL